MAECAAPFRPTRLSPRHGRARPTAVVFEAGPFQQGEDVDGRDKPGQGVVAGAPHVDLQPTFVNRTAYTCAKAIVLLVSKAGMISSAKVRRCAIAAPGAANS